MGQSTTTAENGVLEFWRLKRVVEVTGLSKSEIYRRISAGRFPSARTYPGTEQRFWLSRDVAHWQREILGECDQYEGLLG